MCVALWRMLENYALNSAVQWCWCKYNVVTARVQREVREGREEYLGGLGLPLIDTYYLDTWKEGVTIHCG